MPFLTQPSSFPGLGLVPPMAPITVEAGGIYNKQDGCKKIKLKKIKSYIKVIKLWECWQCAVTEMTI
jgi:hypothetical protein